jgi:cell division protein FtsQ
MWARVRPYLSLAAGIVCGLGVLAAFLGALYWFLAPERFPVRGVEFRGELKITARADLERALPRTPDNFFAADLGEVRASVERLPWVRRVAVRRVWPDRIEVAVEEHVALARWSDQRLVNTHGETFSAQTRQELPFFVAPAGTSTEVARRYHSFTRLVAPLGTEVERVVLTPRHAWQLRLGNGLHLMLGRDGDAAEARLRRFVALYPEVGKKHLEYVDLRYPNGFAMRVPGTGS